MKRQCPPFELIAIGILAFLAAYVVAAALRPLGIPDEYRYAVIPRAMLNGGDWVTPRLLGQLYFEKPVLGYWLIASSEALLGLGALAVRLPMVLATGLTALIFAWAARRNYREEVLSTTVLALYLSGSVLIYFLGVCAVLDSLLALFTSLLSLMTYAALTTRNGRHRIGYLLIAGVSGGMAFLTKGPIGLILPGLGILGFIIWTRRWRDVLRLFWMLPTFLAVVLPWGWAIHRAQPDFWRYFIFVEHIQRFTAPESGQHQEGWWFFAALLPVMLLPGLLITIGGSVRLKWRDFRALLRDDMVRFALASLLLPTIFLSCSGGKLATYLLPTLGFGILLEATVLFEAYRSTPDYLNKFAAVSLRTVEILLAASGVGAILVCAFLTASELDYPPGLPQMLCATGLAGAVGAALLELNAAAPLRRRLAILLLALGLIAGVGQEFRERFTENEEDNRK